MSRSSLQTAWVTLGPGGQACTFPSDSELDRITDPYESPQGPPETLGMGAGSQCPPAELRTTRFCFSW